MSTSYKNGILGEKIVINYLKKSGFEILKHRFLIHNLAELDIIAVSLKENLLLVVEVKTVSIYNSIYDPSLLITAKKLSKIHNGIMHFLSENSNYAEFNIRVDLLVVKLESRRLQHIKNILNI